MDRGWVKLWRKTIDNEILQNPELLSFWIWCLLKAYHKEKTIFVGKQKVVIGKGCFLFGRRKAAIELNSTEQKIRTCLSSLESTNNITIKSTNKFSIISIINWDIYQSGEKVCNQQINQQDNQPATNNQPASNQQSTTINNIENVENVKIEDIKPKKVRQKKDFVQPTLEEVVSYFLEKGYSGQVGKKAFEYYLTANWHDSKGNPVRNWKQKMIAVWFKDENKIGMTGDWKSDFNKKSGRIFLERNRNETDR